MRFSKGLSLAHEASAILPPRTNRASSEYVTWLQRTLNQALGLRLAIDGVMGTQTRSAIRSFQEKSGLLADGVVGPKTEAALIGRVARPSGSSPAGGVGLPAGPDVIRWVQTALNAVRGLRLVVDGKLGPQTRSAIRSFQGSQNLAPTGQVDPPTAQRIASAFSGVRAGKSSCTGLQPTEILDHLSKADVAPENEEARRKHLREIGQIALCIKESQRSSTPIRTVDLIGHASVEGEPDFNERLGRARAERVKAILKSTLNSLEAGLGERVTLATDSRGAQEPRGGAPENDRRVQILLPIGPPPPIEIPPDVITPSTLEQR